MKNWNQIFLFVLVCLNATTILVFFSNSETNFRTRFLQTFSRSAERLPDPCPLLGAGTFTPVEVPATALVSFPGSGNSWTRYMLTTSSGILIGTVYNMNKEVSVTYNEGRSKRLLAVKSHLSPKGTRRYFKPERCILIVRSPYDAILAEFNRNGKTHLNVRRREEFETAWPKFVDKSIGAWKSLYVQWSREFIPTYVLLYSRMMRDPTSEVNNTLYFLNLSFVTPRIHCAVHNRENTNHRKKPDWLAQVAVFSEKQIESLNAAITEVRAALERKTGQDFSDMEQWKR